MIQHQGQRSGTIAQRTADTQQVTFASAAACQRKPWGYSAEHGQGQAQRTVRGVATDQAQRTALRHQAQTVSKALQPVG
ncbi:hypothetical protein A245_41250, partial [Pseudomonas syringae pv. actinidiae ICMP 19096]